MTIREIRVIYATDPLVYVYHTLTGKKYYLGVFSKCSEKYLGYEAKIINSYTSGQYTIFEIGI